jgi:hypothetical protein
VRPTRAEWTLLVLALLLRLGLVTQATWLPVSDTRDYHDLARNLATGQGYVQVYEGERPEYRGLAFHAYRMPGYPAFLASIYSLFGWDPRVGYSANVACELGTQVLLMVLGRRLLDPGASLVAQAFFATHVVWTPSLMTESLFTFLFTGLVLMIVSRVTASTGGAAGFGLLLALAVFVRPIAVAALPVALLQAWRVEPRRRVAMALLIVPLGFGLTAWSVRNHQRLDETVILTTNLGAHNAPFFGIDRARVVEDARRRGLNEAGINEVLLDEIGETVAQSPAWAAVLYVRRAVALFSLGRPWEVRALHATRTFAPPAGSALAHGAYGALLFQYYVAYPLALVGAILLAREGRALHGIWLALAIYILAHAVVSNGNFRLAAPLYPLLCLFAGYAVVSLLALSRSARTVTPSD